VGSRLRVSAQLIKAADGFHLWSGRSRGDGSVRDTG
jgi:TolB-like protein